MKLEINIYEKNYFDKIFAFRLKDRFDIIRVLLKIFFLILNYYDSGKKEKIGNIIVFSAKMSRVFLFSKDKKFSLSFPFRLDIEKRKIFSKKGYEINHHRLSFLNIIFAENFNNFDEIVEKIWDNDEGYNFKDLNELKDIIYELLFFEDGYIRYDIDKENENGKLHPLYHFDIFYTKNNQFKIGLNNILSEGEFIDFLDISTDCKFLK